MSIREKIVIKEKEPVYLPATNLIATLSWKTSVDLDLYAFYRTPNGDTGRVYFSAKTGLGGVIRLDGDAGVGDIGGDNEENMTISDLSRIEHLVIAANIYGKSGANFAKYNSRVLVKTDLKEFEVPLTSTTGGSWAVIAWVNNSNPDNPQLNNVNIVQKHEPQIAQVIGEAPAPSASRGFFGSVFGG